MTTQPNPAHDEVQTAAFAELNAAGLACTPQRDRASEYAEVPLADGSMILFSGITADGKDVRMTHPVRDHGGWEASWCSPTKPDVTHIYDSYGQGLSHEEDTAALIASIVERAREHEGSKRTDTDLT